jgi:hypothetical protein
MEQQKKHWYQKWWGWFILFFFWVIAAPIAIFQSKLSPKAKKIGYGIYVVFLILGLIGAFGEKGSNTPIKNENKITVNKNESKAKKTTVIDETKQKQNIENNVKSEKKRVRDEFQKYESRHLKLWNDMTDAMQKSDVHSAYGYADEIKTVLFGIWQDLSKFKCNKTGDNEFDKQCEETVTLGENAYLAKQEAVNKLLKWFDDLQSPKKANEAKKSLEEGGQYWQAFILKLAALTITDEELNNSKTKK